MVMTRTEIINQAKEFSGPLATSLFLTAQYDWILRKITSRYPLIRNQQKTGELTVDQNYLVLPPNFAFPELFKVDGNEVDYVEPEEWRSEYDESDSSGSPSVWTVNRADDKLYMHVPPSTAWDFIFYYTATHPKAGKTHAFTSGGTYEIKPGVTVTGGTSGATGVVSFIRLTSGTWTGGTAAGNLVYSSQAGTFSAENLNVGSNLNVASISAVPSSEDNFQHFLGEQFEQAIIYGLASLTDLRCSPPQAEKYVFHNDLFEEEMKLMSNIFGMRFRNTTYRDF